MTASVATCAQERAVGGDQYVRESRALPTSSIVIALPQFACLVYRNGNRHARASRHTCCGSIFFVGSDLPMGDGTQTTLLNSRLPAIVGPARLSNSGRAPWTFPKDEPSSNPHYPRIRDRPAGSDRNPRIRLSIVCNSYCVAKPLRGRPTIGRSRRGLCHSCF